jgi:hypothetical protein
MASMLSDAKLYLFGRTDGSATAPCTGTTSPSYCINTTYAHLPYTFFVPDYATTDTTYFASLDSTLSTYRANILGSAATALEKTVQLAGTKKFGINQAVVTSHVSRSRGYGLDCVKGYTP